MLAWSTRLGVRALDDFFQPRTPKTKTSDIRATDFYDYKSPGAFLSKTQRDSINQRIAHLTYEPIWTGTTGIGSEPCFEWNTAEYVSKAVRAAFEFMKFLEQKLSKEHPDRSEEIRKVRIAFEQGLIDMEAWAEEETKQFAARAKNPPKGGTLCLLFG